MSGGVIPPEQFDGLKHNSAMEGALPHALLFDIIRLKRTTAAVSSFDTNNCYDCIVHSFASLSMQACRIPMGVVVTMSLVIQAMEFFLRTAYGDSDCSYCGDWRRSFQGL